MSIDQRFNRTFAASELLITLEAREEELKEQLRVVRADIGLERARLANQGAINSTRPASPQPYRSKNPIATDDKEERDKLWHGKWPQTQRDPFAFTVEVLAPKPAAMQTALEQDVEEVERTISQESLHLPEPPSSDNDDDDPLDFTFEPEDLGNGGQGGSLPRLRSETGSLTVHVSAVGVPGAEAVEVQVDPLDFIQRAVIQALSGALHVYPGIEKDLVVEMGNERIGTSPYQTFEEYGVQTGARLSVSLHSEAAMAKAVVNGSRRDKVLSVAKDMHAMCGIDYDVLMQRTTFDANGSLVNWDLSRLGIKRLPPSFGKLVLHHDLDLRENSITELPAEFARICIGRNLHLRHNIGVNLGVEAGPAGKVVPWRGMQVGGKVFTNSVRRAVITGQSNVKLSLEGGAWVA